MGEKTKGFACPKCKGDLYVIDTRGKAGRGSRYTPSQWRQRRYGCVGCHARYMSLEVLNPVSYMNKPIPESRWEKPDE